MRPAILCALLLAPGRLAAQAAWVPPQPPCDIKPGHFRLNSAPVNFKTAYEKPQQRDRMLAQTLDVVTRALTQDKQDKNPAAWYYLGRYYVEVRDARGADSAFDRAVALAPQCEQDVDGHRRQLWADMYSAAERNRQEGRVDSAAMLYRAAHALLPADARPLYALGAMFALRDEVDSATVYLRRAVAESAGDTAYADSRREVLRQVGRLQHRRAQGAPAVQALARARFSHDSVQRRLSVDSVVLARMESSAAARRARGGRLSPADQQAFARDSAARAQAVAAARTARAGIDARIAADSAGAWPVLEPAIATLRELVTVFPDDGDGVTALAQLYAWSGRSAEAATAFDAIYPAATSLEGATVIDAARRVLRAGLTASGIALLSRGLEKSPYDRDGWNDVAAASRSVFDGQGMLRAGRRLVDLDPLNRSNFRQVAIAWELLGQPDSARRYEAVADTGIKVEISVASFVPAEGGAVLTALAVNTADQPSRPLTLTFEFVGGASQVVATERLTIPAIPAQGTHQFEMRVAETAARGWRYRLN